MPSNNESNESKEMDEEEEMALDETSGGEIAKDDDDEDEDEEENAEVTANNNNSSESNGKSDSPASIKANPEPDVGENESEGGDEVKSELKKEEVTVKENEEENGRKKSESAKEVQTSASKVSTKKENEGNPLKRKVMYNNLNGSQETPRRGSSSITVTHGGVYQDEEDDDDDVNMIEAKDDREGCRSLICDSNGIIVAEMVYRCMICANISDSIAEAQKHYQVKHILNECSPSSMNNNNNSYTSNPRFYPSFNEESDVDESFSSITTPTVTFNVPSSLKQLQKQVNPPPPNSTSLLLKKQVPNTPAANMSMTKTKNAVNGGGQGTSRGGFVTCAVCNITKFYASVQRRYGQFTCMGCAKFFGRFLIKPRKYFCPNLGSCPLDTSPRCKACLLLACINTYTIDQERMKIVNANRPAKKSGPPGGTSGTTSITIGQQESQPVVNNVLTKADSSKAKTASITVTSNSAIVNSLKETTITTITPPLSSSVTTRSSVSSSITTRDSARKSASQSSQNGATVSPIATRKLAGCRSCPGCLSPDCGKCNYCLDKPKFGGPNTLKKKCARKICVRQT